MSEPNFFIKLFKFLTNKVFFRNILTMVILTLLLLIGLHFYLNVYTNHGQKLALPDFNGMHIDKAQKMAKEESFQLIVNDSTHVIGKPGGIILSQRPSPSALVKENRKVYVQVTKYNSDLIRLSSLPELYGRAFEQKKKELGHLQINSRIKEYKYDPGEPDHILEVYYNDELVIDRDSRNEEIKIEKGGTLDFVLSKLSGLEIEVPNLKCQTFAEARFVLEQGTRLQLGIVTDGDGVDDESREEAFVVSQYPHYSEGATMLVGESIDIVLALEKPDECDEGDVFEEQEMLEIDELDNKGDLEEF